MKIFTDHPASVGETYFEHMGGASYFADRMFVASKGGKASLGSVLALVSVLFVSAPTLAQDGDANYGDDTIVVTGSRIARTGFDTPTPTTVVNYEKINLTGLNNIADVVAQLPAFYVGVAPANATSTDDGGAQLVNLRGLGTNRTLVVVNGRRRVSGSSSSAGIDLSTIPAGMVDRIEIVTGGASAVYGADAVTGVVNIVLRDDFEGLQFTARGGVSEGGGADSYSFNAYGGTDFHDGRGSATLSVSYNNQGKLDFSQRPSSRTNPFSLANPENTGPNDGIFDNILFPDVRFNNFAYGGAFTIGQIKYTVDPGLRPIMHDAQTGTSFSGIGGDGWNPGDFFQHFGDQEIVSSYATLGYEITDNVRFFSELDYTESEYDVAQNITLLFGAATPTIMRDNPFVSAELGALMDDNGLNSFTLTKGLFDIGPALANHDRETLNITAGFEGEFSNDWSWSVFAQRGNYENNISTANLISISRLLQAADAITNPNDPSEIVCRDPSGGCVPINLLGRNSESAAALDFVNHTRLQNINNQLFIVGGNLNGELISLPAGPVKFVAGAEYRTESILTEDDGLILSGDIQQFTATPNRDASFNVREVYSETLIPIIAEVPLIEEFNIEGAVRYSDYDTIGSTFAWKAAADWALSEDIRIRATRSRNVRAPNLNELFAPGGSGFITILDPCDADNINLGSTNRSTNCAALEIPVGFADPNAGFQKMSFSGGNPNLTEETSDSLTVGVVMTPNFVDGLRLSVDFWDIDIQNAVSSVGGQRIVDQCVDVATIDNPFCAQIQRGSDFGIEVVSLQEINIGNLSANGLDVELAYGFDLFGNGEVDLTYLGSFLFNQDELVDANDATTLLERAGEADRPQIRMNWTVNYANGPFSANSRTRLIGSSVIDNLVSDEFRDDNNIHSALYQDVTFTYNVSDSTSASFGVNNVFNRLPQVTEVTAIPRNDIGPLYDIIGRFFYVGVEHKF